MKLIICLFAFASLLVGCSEDTPDQHRYHLCYNFCYGDNGYSAAKIKSLTYTNNVTECVCTDERHYSMADSEQKPNEKKDDK